MGNCQTKKATTDAVAPGSSEHHKRSNNVAEHSRQKQTDASPPQNIATTASDTEPATPEKAEPSTAASASGVVSVNQSPSHDAVVQELDQAVSKAASKDSTIQSGGDFVTRESSAKSSVIVPLAPTAEASTVVNAAVSGSRSRSMGGVTNDVDGNEEQDDHASMWETTVVTQEQEKPKSFMDQIDAFRDSCCGVGGGQDRGITTDDEDAEVEEEAAARIETANSSSAMKSVGQEVSPVNSEEGEKTVNATAYPMPDDHEGKDDLEKERSSVSRGSASTSFLSRMRSKASTAGPTASSKDSSTVLRSVSTSSVVSNPNDPNYKVKRKLNKKLREIEALEKKDPDTLTPEQKEKLESKESVLQSLQDLE